MPFAKAIQHPVGQGGFYTCDVWCSEHHHPTRFIYDCGSSFRKQYLHEAIDKYADGIEKNSVDFIVISHFDADHINGMSRLLDQVGEVGTVFLPYLSPLEKIIIGIRNRDESKEYYQLLTSPVEFLRERGVTRIVYVTNNGEDDSNFDGIPPIEPDTTEGDDKRKEVSPLKYRALKKSPDDWDGQNTDSTHQDSVVTLDHNEPVSSHCWLFKFFNYLPKPKNNRPFIKSCKAERAVNHLKYEIKALTGKVVDDLGSQDIIELLDDKSKVKKLKEKYKELQYDHNNVSLALWHGPFTSSSSDDCIAHWLDQYRLYSPYPYSMSRSSSDGTFLTGDLDIGLDLTQIKKHYGDDESQGAGENLLSRTAFFQVPHHGSKNSWDKEILRAFNNSTFCFVSAGFSNRYSHPGLDVIKDIVENGNTWAQSHEVCQIDLYVNYRAYAKARL